MSRTVAWRLPGAVLLAGTFGCLGAGAPHAGAASLLPSAAQVNFTAAAAAPVMQVTEDEPTSQFHPEGEGEYGYTLATANPSAASALAAVAWPGSAAGNAGTLVEVLGGPSSLSALNDPVQASASTGTSRTHSSISAPSGSTMTASVDPTGPTDEHATATSAMAGGGLGPAGTTGESKSNSTIDFDSGTAVLSVMSDSTAADMDIAGVVRIGSVTSSASARAVNGGTPKLSGSTDFHDMSIAGQAAYLDGSGVHIGAPGAPAGPAAVESVDAALASAGMEVYFTAPHTITVGGTAYYYAASVLFYWAPPGDPSHNSFTLSLGGSAVSVSDSAEPAFGLGGIALGPSGGGGAGGETAPALAPAGSAATPGGATGVTAPALAAAGSSNPTAGGATLSLPASPSAAADGTTGGSAGSPLAAATRLPGGVGAGWWVLVGLAALAGAALTTRIPALLQRQSAAACPRAARPARPGRSGTAPGNGRNPS